MKLKYYLRGLGIGIIVTAILMGVTLSGPKNMSDEDVKKRAVELGMIEGTTLTEGYGTVTVTPSSEEVEDDHPNIIVPTEGASYAGPVKTEEITPALLGQEESDASETSEATISEDGEEMQTEDGNLQEGTEDIQLPDDTEIEAQTPEVESSEAGVQESQETEDTQETVVPDGSVYEVSVVRGDSSGSVCKRMENDGIIESAKEFDHFLCQKGYDTKLAFGTHEIRKDMTFEEMAQSLMGH